MHDRIHARLTRQGAARLTWICWLCLAAWVLLFVLAARLAFAEQPDWLRDAVGAKPCKDRGGAFVCRVIGAPFPEAVDAAPEECENAACVVKRVAPNATVIKWKAPAH